MKKAVLIATFMIFAGSAHAQGYSGSINGASGIGSSGSLNSAMSLSSAGGLNGSGAISAPQLNAGSSASAAPSYTNVDGTNPGEYVPSTFTSYSEAVSTAKANANVKPPTLAELARQAQAGKKAADGKSCMVLDKDGNGKLIVTTPAPTRQ
jgi:hypothetical protein